MKLFVTCFACVLLASCTHSSGVLKMGPDTYTVSAAAHPIRGGPSEARKIAMTEANQYCTRMGKEILVANAGVASINVDGAGSVEVTFRCFDKGDLGLRHPEYRHTQDNFTEPGTVEAPRVEPNTEARIRREIIEHCARWGSFAEHIAQARDRQVLLATEIPNFIAEFWAKLAPDLLSAEDRKSEKIDQEIYQAVQGIAAEIYATTHTPSMVRVDKEMTCRGGMAGFMGIPQF